MADDVIWTLEKIPDHDSVYMRAHTDFVRDGVVQPSVFREHKGAMSVDWKKYSTPQQTRDRAKIPSANAVIQMQAGEIRAIHNLKVEHRPMPTNRAHSDVLGLPSDNENLTEARVLLLACSTVVLSLAEPGTQI